MYPDPDNASVAGMKGDCGDAIEIVKRQWPSLEILLVGEGVGASFAASLATQVDAVGLISPVYHLRDVALPAHTAPFLKNLVQDSLKTIESIRRASVPIHLVHGTLDGPRSLQTARSLTSGNGRKLPLEEIPGADKESLRDALVHSPFAEGFRTFVSGTSPSHV